VSTARLLPHSRGALNVSLGALAANVGILAILLAAKVQSGRVQRELEPTEAAIRFCTRKAALGLPSSVLDPRPHRDHTGTAFGSIYGKDEPYC
jgi:hypothetical protein